MGWNIYIDASDRKVRKVSITNSETSASFETVSDKGGITELIEELLIAHEISLDMVDEIKSNPGPGSFTGLKSGAVAANVLNWALRKKSISDLQLP